MAVGMAGGVTREEAEGMNRNGAYCAQEVPWKMGKPLVAKTMVQKTAGNKFYKEIGKFYHTVLCMFVSIV